MNSELAYIEEARREFHAALVTSVLRVDGKGIPNNADKSQNSSVNFAIGMVSRFGSQPRPGHLSGQKAGAEFERACAEYIGNTFLKLQHLRPGSWEVTRDGLGKRLALAQFDQYTHLAALDELARESPQLSAALGSDYLIKPDIVVVRFPVDDEVINTPKVIVNDTLAKLTSLRKANNTNPILHASISCKWTLRSDRAQNARSEALNLVRNRKGRLPHIVVVTGEPMPGRIASIALGTGDIDCVYHVALPELVESVKDAGSEDSEELLRTMVEGKRLRDIADLPFDLAV